MRHAARRSALALTVIGLLAVGCESTQTPIPQAPLPKLDLQVRNSGIHGGYLWLGVTGGGGRWHQFGDAEFVCVTCPVPFSGAGPSYEIAVFDEACQLLAREHPPGGNLQVAIELGPRVLLIDAPPVVDWMPSDSPPIDPSDVPCASGSQ